MSESHGLVLADKPAGWTSHDLVDFARKLFKTKAVGHCGTLDPMASGLMVLLIGEATKLSHYVLENDKTYDVQFRLGVTTDTLDTTGAILATQTLTEVPKKLQELIQGLQGAMEYPVPMFSAAKVDGMKLHEYARSGIAVEAPRKIMSFQVLNSPEVLKTDAGFEVKIRLRCSKGGFVRSWVHELGIRLGCGAAMSGLIRLGSEPYHLDQARTKAQLERLAMEGKLSEALLPLSQALPEYHQIRVQGLDEVLLSNGQISHSLKNQIISLFNPDTSKGVKIISKRTGQLLALIGLEPGKGFVIRRGFRY